MEQKSNFQIPFDFYDFFGYLFPGTIMSIYLLIFFSYAFPTMNLSNLLTIFSIDKEPIVSGLLKTFAIIVLIYVIGHFIATISSIIIDKILISGISGYPILFLLDLKKESRPFIAATYKYLFLFMNLTIVCSFFAINPWIFVVLIFLILVLIGIRIIIEISRQSNWKMLESVKRQNWIRYYIAPMKWIDIVAKSANAAVGGDRKFPAQFIEKYKEIFNKKYQLDCKNLGSENYWLSYFITVRNDPSSLALFRTWLHLYGFARNLSAASFIMSFLITAIIIIYQPLYLKPARLQLSITYLIAWVFLARYWILYRSYYTKSIIRAFVAMNSVENK